MCYSAVEFHSGNLMVNSHQITEVELQRCLLLFVNSMHFRKHYMVKRDAKGTAGDAPGLLCFCSQNTTISVYNWYHFQIYSIFNVMFRRNINKKTVKFLCRFSLSSVLLEQAHHLHHCVSQKMYHVISPFLCRLLSI